MKKTLYICDLCKKESDVKRLEIHDNLPGQSGYTQMDLCGYCLAKIYKIIKP